MPSTIEQLSREYRARGLAVLAINIEESRDTVRRWVTDRKLTLDVLLDPPGAVSGAYQVTATPTAFLVNRDGRLVAKAIGTKAWTGAHGRALLEAMLTR